MKVLAILLCAFAAVQGRSAVVPSSKSLAALGDEPYILHLRIAIGTSGFLNTGAASLISANYALSDADVLYYSCFIWIRYGVVSVPHPSLVTETSTVTTHGPIALIGINRHVLSTPHIAPVSLGGGDVSKVNKFCSFGADSTELRLPGESLTCSEASAEKSEEGSIEVNVDTTEFDYGAPLVDKNGVQVAVLIKGDSESGTFVSIEGFLEWIENNTDAVINIPAPPSSESSEENFKVNFVN